MVINGENSPFPPYVIDLYLVLTHSHNVGLGYQRLPTINTIIVTGDRETFGWEDTAFMNRHLCNYMQVLCICHRFIRVGSAAKNDYFYMIIITVLLLHIVIYVY